VPDGIGSGIDLVGRFIRHARPFDELRSEELARLAMIEREAWAAWRRSQQPAQTATVDGQAGSQKANRGLVRRPGGIVEARVDRSQKPEWRIRRP
jgi:hypothetical protein